MTAGDASLFFLFKLEMGVAYTYENGSLSPPTYLGLLTRVIFLQIFLPSTSLSSPPQSRDIASFQRNRILLLRLGAIPHLSQIRPCFTFCTTRVRLRKHPSLCQSLHGQIQLQSRAEDCKSLQPASGRPAMPTRYPLTRFLVWIKGRDLLYSTPSKSLMIIQAHRLCTRFNVQYLCDVQWLTFPGWCTWRCSAQGRNSTVSPPFSQNPRQGEQNCFAE